MQSKSSDKYVCRYDFEILNLFDSEFHYFKISLINTRPIFKNKSKELLRELRKFKFQTILVLEYKKRKDRKIFQSGTKLVAKNSDVDKNIMTKIKKICLRELDCLRHDYKA